MIAAARWDRHPEFSGGFIVAGRNCSELFHRTREILDEMAFPIGFAVEFEQVQAGSAWTGSQLICRRLPVARGPVCRHRRPSRRSTEQPPFSAGARPCRPRSCACPGGGMNAKGLPSAFDRGVGSAEQPPFSAGARPCRPRSCACPGGGMNAKGLPSAFDRGVDFGVSPPQPRPITCSSSFGRARRRYAGEPRTILLSITSLTYY